MVDDSKSGGRISTLFGKPLSLRKAVADPQTHENTVTDGDEDPSLVAQHSANQNVAAEDLLPELSFLIVDDVRCTCDVIFTLLRALGVSPYKMHMATTLFGAMQLVRSRHFDVIISDLHLRVGTGLELLDSIRNNSPIPEAAFLLITNDPEAEEMKKAKALGVSSILLKPLSVSNLLEHLTYCLDHPAVISGVTLAALTLLEKETTAPPPAEQALVEAKLHETKS